MRWHIIRPLVSMCQIRHRRITCRGHKAAEKVGEVGFYLGVGVFLNEEGTGRVAHKQRQQSGPVDPRGNISGKLIKPLAVCLECENRLHDCHMLPLNTQMSPVKKPDSDKIALSDYIGGNYESYDCIGF